MISLPVNLPHWISPCGKIILFNCHYQDLFDYYGENRFDLAIVDPPYGNKTDMTYNHERGKHYAKRKEYVKFNNDIAPDQKYFDDLDRVSKKKIVWGGNFFGIKGGVIAWNKHGEVFGEGEVAICNTHASVRFFDFAWNGMIQGDQKNKEIRIHSTQKPVQLYSYCLINYAKPGFKILDTHLGSASIAIAVDKCNKIDSMNLTFVGCEILPEIYDLAVKRVSEEIKKEYVRLVDDKNESFQHGLFDEE